MTKSLELQFRPYDHQPPLKGSARIQLRKDDLISLTGSLDNDRLCTVEKVGEPSSRREALLGAAPENLKKERAKISKVFLEACGFNFSDRYLITVTDGAVPEAQEVVLEDVTSKDSVPPVAGADLITAWEVCLQGQLALADHVFPGMVVKDVYLKGPRRSFVVKTVNRRSDSVARFVLDATKVVIAGTNKEEKPPTTSSAVTNGTATTSPPTPSLSPSSRRLEITGVAGMDDTIEALNYFLADFELPPQATFFERSCAMVLHGDPGCGKTMLLGRVAQTGWGAVHRIRPGDKLSTIEETFQKAAEQQPSIVLLDDVQRLVGDDRSNRAAVVRALGDALDALAVPRGSDAVPKVVVLAACLSYWTDIPTELRTPGRLDDQIRVPFPDVACRRAILESLNMPLPPDSRADIIEDWSRRTHAFNGHDLVRLTKKAAQIGQAAFRRRRTAAAAADSSSNSTGSNGPNGSEESSKFYLTNEHLEKARLQFVPSSMDGVMLKPRPVYWRQVRGQERVREALTEAVRNMYHPDEYRALVKPFPKGFLLYGPSGCSKTMAAQAMATESGLNFFAVKGGELLNQYVGESERAVRELFARARRAAPSIIFFDEIDAIAGRRSGFGSSGPAESSSSSRRGGPEIVTTLLTEMDGFEPLKGVLIVAATNRPQTLDPALLRPGRFDRVLYVPPPDHAAREDILRGWAEGMRVAADVDLARLAALTDGYSGSEVLGICQVAGSAAARGLLRGEPEPHITMAHFEEAVRHTARTITQEMLDGFRRWELHRRTD